MSPVVNESKHAAYQTPPAGARKPRRRERSDDAALTASPLHVPIAHDLAVPQVNRRPCRQHDR